MKEEIEIKLPKLGESIVSATVVQWFKKVGDFIKLDEPLLEVSTDKINSEIPSPISGTLVRILAEPDQELQVGETLALMSSSEAAPSETFIPTQVKKEEALMTQSKRGLFTPVVLKIAQEKGVDLDELEKIPATGAGGRLSKRDLEKYLEEQKSCPFAKKAQHTETQCIKMTGMRKFIAESMLRTHREIPSATLVNEVDVTEIIDYIAREREQFRQQYGYKLSITSFIARAIAKAVKEFPHVNSTVEQDTIVIKPHVNLGIAVSVDQGILVPVIPNCDTLTLEEIANAVSDLSFKARSNKLDPNQVQEGTITMTNFGMSGTLIGVPIIRYPEVAIIGIGAIQKKVVAFENNTMGIRSMMHLTLTFDHRVIDGMYGCSFLGAIKNHLRLSQ